MTERSEQADRWAGEFGEEWTDRNPDSVREMDESYREKFGTTRTALNRQFLDVVDRDARVLEVGCNLGIQLAALRELGFENLYGIDVMADAVERAHELRPTLDVIEGDALDIPFKDDFFDLVFTSGTLIHVDPSDVELAVSEIARCSREYVWGYEYFAEEYTEVTYRGHENFLWKADFPGIYQRVSALEPVSLEYLEYPDSGNRDVMFLLRRSGSGDP